MPGPPPDDTWHDEFIRALDSTKSVLKSCKTTGVARPHAYEHKAKYPEFAQRWESIIDAQLDSLEESALVRARTGFCIKEVIKDGEVIAREYRPETALTIFILQKRRPEVYGDAVPAPPVTSDVEAWKAARRTMPKANGRTNGTT